MTAVRTPDAPPGTVEPAPGPVPRRVRPPRWLDLRLVLGVLLVLGSVLLGARVVSAADATVPVWSVTSDLTAGTVLSAADLVAVDVRLDAVADAYLSAGSSPAGRTLARPVRAGELLPRAALEQPGDLVQLALPVQAGYVPPGLRRGDLVDVYALTDPAGGAGSPGEVGLVVANAPVQELSGRSEGVLSTPTTTVQVIVSVTAQDAPAVLAAIGGRPLAVVVHDSVEGDGAARPTAGTGPARPATASAPSTSPTSQNSPTSSTDAGD